MKKPVAKGWMLAVLKTPSLCQMVWITTAEWMKAWVETISFKYPKTALEGLCPQTGGVAEEDNHQLHLSVASELQEGFRKKKKKKGLGAPGSSL